MRSLQVFLETDLVGTLLGSDDEAYRFSFAEAWLKDPLRPILGQLFEDRRPYDIETSGMPCWFAHLLPQGPLRRMLAHQERIDEPDNLAILTLCGGDLPGAVVLKAVFSEDAGSKPPRPKHREGLNTPAIKGEMRLGFSLAGNQWKLSVQKQGRGLVVPVFGQGGMYIAKFEDPSYPHLPRVEYATTLWAKEAGIVVPNVELVERSRFLEPLPSAIPEMEGLAFVAERFDRSQDVRIHMEDFGQILDRPPGDSQFKGSYEEIAAVLAYLAPSDLKDYVTRLVFCILCGNGDAHLKNWSMIYPDRRTPRLSPAYDLVPTVLYLPRDKLALSLGGVKEFSALTRLAFEGLARVTGISVVKIGSWVDEARDKILSALSTNLPFTEEERRRISEHVRRVPFSCGGSG